jgi:hypothetical protein
MSSKSIPQSDCAATSPNTVDNRLGHEWKNRLQIVYQPCFMAYHNDPHRISFPGPFNLVTRVVELPTSRKITQIHDIGKSSLSFADIPMSNDTRSHSKRSVMARLLVAILALLVSSACPQQFKGVYMPMPYPGLSTSCQTALNTTITCPFLLNQLAQR